MKNLFFFLIFFPVLALAKGGLTSQEFDRLPLTQKVKVIEAYRSFLKAYSMTVKYGKYSSVRLGLFEEAWASGNFDCFYAGWPSQSSAKSGGGRLCNSPIRGNPDYPSQASSCGSSSLLCQPALFGSGLCVSVATPALRNSAFAQCESKFSQAGRSTTDVVSELSSPEKRSNFDDMLELAQRVCSEGFQSKTGMCANLMKKLEGIKSSLPATSESAAPLSRIAETAVSVTSGNLQPAAEDCPPEEAPSRPSTATSTTPRPPQRISRVFCGSAPRPTSMTPSEISSFLQRNNIQVVYGNATTEQLQDFVAEFQRFPESLREEMRTRGSRINLIVGDGVAQDPSWEGEKLAAPSSLQSNWDQTFDGRPMSEIPGTGGSLGNPGTPTRIVINRLRAAPSSLFLHEYAHTMDSMYGDHRITRSAQWQQVQALDRRTDDQVRTICGNYCLDDNHPEEKFAELFAYYNNCEESRNQMRQVLPNISRFFDSLTNVKDMLEGRISIASQPPARPEAPVQPETRVSDTLVVDSPRLEPSRVSPGLTELVSANLSPLNSRPEVQIPELPVAPEVIPQKPEEVISAIGPEEPQRSPSSSGLVSPSRAIELASGGNLRYLGRGLLPGSDTVGSCVFENAEVYVLLHACHRTGREMPALNVEIITKADGKKTGFYIETSEQVEHTFGLPSQLRRENYDGNWRISYQEIGPAPSPYSLESMRSYLERNYRNYDNTCFVGGMSFQSRPASCQGTLAAGQESWNADANAFHREPPEAWYSFLRNLRQKVQSSAGH